MIRKLGMSELYKVKVIMVTKYKVTLRLVLQHPDAPGALPESKFLAMQLLTEPDFERTAFAKVMSKEDLRDDAYIRKVAPKYIASVKRVAIDNWRPGEAPIISDENDVLLPEKLCPAATYEIRVSDSKLLAHLRAGKKWNSASYADPSAEVAPVRPRKRVAATRPPAEPAAPPPPPAKGNIRKLKLAWISAFAAGAFRMISRA